MKKKWLLFFFIPYAFFAQDLFEEGYIITNTNDTVFGKIRDKEFVSDYANCNKIKFKDRNGNESKKTPYDIKQYDKKGLHFYTLPVGIESSPKFVQVIESGAVVLLGYTNVSLSTSANDMGAKIKERTAEGKKNSNSNVDYFLQFKNKPNSLMKVRRKTFEETAGFFFQDNEELVQKIAMKKYQYLDMPQLVKLYNEAKKEPK
ncbi:MAG: hypothetical protein JST67_07950 [Bacteroidetes bacterium]|nr:hypothetical protein [Bacteroidota bacterium]